MTGTSVGEFSAAFASLLQSAKADFVVPDPADPEGCQIRQFGAVSIGRELTSIEWPSGLSPNEPAIETFVATGDQIEATSNNQPYVEAWLPAATALNTAVRDALRARDVEIAEPAYITASIIRTSELEGTAHFDDEMYLPGDGVGVVAIVGQLEGPRVARGALSHGPLRPGTQLQVGEQTLAAFEDRSIEHDQAGPNEIVLFPQFGQLHAGPTSDVQALADERQLLVFRAMTSPVV